MLGRCPSGEVKTMGEHTKTIDSPSAWPRRRVLGFLVKAGLGTAVFQRALVALADEATEVTSGMISQAAGVSGIDFTEKESELMLTGINALLEQYAEVRAVPLANDVPPALRFEVLAGGAAEPSGYARLEPRQPALPANEEDLAFSSVATLATLLRDRQVTSVDLTRIYLDRLRRYGPKLHSVIHATDELALAQARRADEEIAAGHWRGPLHGVPWGAKDLLAVPGKPTTWGARPYEGQVLEDTATVAARLGAAGAVLVAKLSVGALAWGDVWYGGTTRNPWKPDQGSSGSSAGPGSATAAGLAGFTIGTETWGSIVSPSTRCGVSGLRPTFGRVSRYGCMALSWSMDKIGPMARSVEDCAFVFDAIRGADGLDPTAVDGPFRWPLGRDVRSLRVGYVKDQFEPDFDEIEDEDARRRAEEWHGFNLGTLEALRRMGIELIPVELPTELPVGSLSYILTAEASAAFDDLTRSGRDDLLVRQIERAWPNVFRQGQLITAVEYIRANRVRTLVMHEMERLMSDIDVYVSPTFGGSNLLMTNLTGHPQVVLPNGFRAGDGTPTSITFTGRLFGESELLALAHEYQRATGFHMRRPDMQAVEDFEEPAEGHSAG
jgi:Asp-tRNA(Asn)/Glu-tRNA(Gln) amidotransferase A subunit family amidase